MMLDGERLNWAEAEGIENRMTYKGERKENEWKESQKEREVLGGSCQ